MQTTTEPLVSRPGMSVLQRPRFGAGLLLEAEDLTAGVDYTRELLRLLLRSLFGCGVVCDLKVTARRTCQTQKLEITVGSGLALDCMGNAIHVPTPVTVTYDPHLDCVEMPPAVWVTACYLEKCCRPKDVACSPDDDGTILHTRSHDGFVIKVYGERPPCACGCKPDRDANGKVIPTPISVETEVKCDCYREHHDGKCACACDCECVLLAEIDTTQVDVSDDPKKKAYKSIADPDVKKEAPLRVITRDVRKIRPLVTGFLECLEPKPKATGTGSTGGTGTDTTGTGEPVIEPAGGVGGSAATTPTDAGGTH